MPNVNDIYRSTASAYLTAADLSTHQPVVTIERWEEKQFTGGRTPETKLIVFFRGKAKALKCNKTQARAIEAILGTGDWTGGRIQLYATMTTYAGDPCPTIGVKAPVAASRPQPVAPARPAPVPAARPVAVNERPRYDATLDDVPF